MQEFPDPRIDRERGALYLAEDQVLRIMRARGRAVRLNGRTVVLPELLSFGTLDTIRDFVQSVVEHPQTVAAYPSLGPVHVVAKRGFRSADYADGEIRIPVADARGSWALAQPVILHECAHHLCGVPGHGQPFRRALVHLYQLHLGPACTEVLRALLDHLEDLPEPGTPRQGDPAMRRVAALLAKAASTDSSEEAEACLAKANLVAHRHSVDLAVAALDRPDAMRATHRMVTIGPPRSTQNKLLVSLFINLARPWRIPVDVGAHSAYVLAYGLPEDLDHLEAMYATAGAVMMSRAAAHASSGQWRGTTYLAPVPGGLERREVTSVVARNAFCVGFIDRLGRKVAQGVEGPTGRGPGEGTHDAPGSQVALRAKELAVRDYHRGTSKARGSWRGTASTSSTATLSRRAGEAAADEFSRRGVGAKRRRAIGSG